MRDSSHKYFSFVLLLTFSSLLHAEDKNDKKLKVVSSASVSDKRMSLDIRDRQFNADFVMGTLSLSAINADFFGSIKVERSIKDDIRSDGTGLIFYSRTDYTLTAGKNLLKSLSAFAGYRQGRTTSYYNVSNNQFDVSSKGVFLGGSYSHLVKDWGSLRFTLAVANLSGEVSLFEPFADRSVIPNAPSKIKGNAVGYSYGVSWNGHFSPSTSYNIDLTLHRYEFKDEEIYGGIDLSFKEDFNTLSIGLTRYF